MTNENPSGDLTAPAQKVATDQASERAPDAKKHFRSPEMLMEDPSVSDTEKLALLQEWCLDLENRLKAEEEGMSASDPMTDRKEAKIADELGRVRSFITALSERIGQSD